MNIWSITAQSNVPSTLGWYASDCVDLDMLYTDAAVDLGFITDNVAKMQKIFAYNGLSWGGGGGYRSVTYHI